MNINIENNSKVLKFNKMLKEQIFACIKYIVRSEKKQSFSIAFKKFIRNKNINNIQIDFLFIDEKEMKKYNKKYFNRKTSTDVIAFSMIEGENIDNNFILGDAIISVETAQKNAELYNNYLKEELFLLIIHSTLHLMGYDHPDDRSIMRKKEKQYFEYIKKKI